MSDQGVDHRKRYKAMAVAAHIPFGVAGRALIFIVLPNRVGSRFAGYDLGTDSQFHSMRRGTNPRAKNAYRRQKDDPESTHRAADTHLTQGCHPQLAREKKDMSG